MKFRYREESEMRESGIEWIGCIPKTWEISRIDKEFDIRREKVSDKDFKPLSVTKKGIVPQLESVAKSDNGDNRKKVCKGDFVINSRADRKGSCGVSLYDGSVSLICSVLTPKKLDSQYIHNLFRNYYFSEEFYRWGSGIVADLWSTNIERMKKINIPIPSRDEDIKIAKFLDLKIKQFNSIISKKEKLIEKLEETKKSLISEVLTGKIEIIKEDECYQLRNRKGDELKRSRLNWVRNIPKEWYVDKTTNILKFSKGLTITKENLKSEGIPCINYGEIHSKYKFEINPEIHKLKFVDNEYLEINPMALLKKGDFVFCDTSEDIQGCGNFTYLNSDINTFAGYHTIIARPIVEINSRYIAYLFTSEEWKSQIRSKVYGVKVYSVSQSILRGTKIILPSEKEQEKIVEYLDSKISIIDLIIYKLKLQIIKIKEAKQSLISEVTTGKIEILN